MPQFACFYSLTSPSAALVAMAETFTPRFEVVGSLVMLDVSGVTRLFGTPRELADQMRRASPGPVRIAIAPTQTTAALVAMGRPGVLVVDPEHQREVLAALPVSVLGMFERVRLSGQHNATTSVQVPEPQAQDGRSRQDLRARGDRVEDAGRARAGSYESGAHVSPALAPPSVGQMEDVLPYFHHSLERTIDAAAAPHLAGAAHLETSTQPAPSSGGWSHPRDAHAAAHTRRPRRAVTGPRDWEHPPAGGVPGAGVRQPAAVSGARRTGAEAGAMAASHGSVARAHKRHRPQDLAVVSLLETLRRWGVATLGQLAALPAGDVYERLGARGVLWQRLAQGEDTTPLVPWVPEDPFEAALALDWPIEGLEPLSFVLGRLLEPLAERLERADRGAAILHTHLRLVDKAVHARTVQLPAPMRDPRTLRTLVLLDLESHPPSAGIDQVRVLIEPTPARITQCSLFERAQPSPEQVSTLLARLTALMGESHVGAPRLVDSWRPGAFEMTPFIVSDRPNAPGASVAGGPDAPGKSSAPNGPSALASSVPGVPTARRASAPDARNASIAPTAPGPVALRRFRLPVPARVHVQEGRPVRIMTDRRGVAGGMIIQSAGPWRTSGEWWNDGPAGRSWDRDEWDVVISDGTVYRIFVERDVGQWFLEGLVD